ncbi:MAG: tetratricopeptide repeat protein [Stenotrophomonas sp.]
MSKGEQVEQASWQQVRQLFDQVCELPAEQWEPALARLSGDPEMIARTLRLLQAQTRELGQLRQQVSELLHHAEQAVPAEGDLLGPWRLQQCLARGGMGMVYLAERADGMYSQQVAVKLLPAMGGQAVAARLVAERRILASLQHPNIARLYDGGSTEAGQPYLVMEYVQGVPLDQWCGQHQPDLATRLQLFEVICQAVQEAHVRLVLHCDLKPANILIRDDGQPVLVDFGVARLLDGAMAGEALAYCTPAYAAPELLHGQHLPDTRSDVFSLGVLLAGLLSGQPSNRGLASWNSPVALPSTQPSIQPAHPGCQPRRLRGDLDAIVARACALEPEQRYPSVAALAMDIQRHRQRRPVQARGSGVFYRGGRWLRRNWSWLLALLAVLALVAGFVWQLQQQRQRAEQQARIADEVTRFMVEAFDAANPRKAAQPGDGQVSARQVLDASVARIDEQALSDPQVKARLQVALAQAYQNIGLAAQARGLYAQAVPVLLAGQDRVELSLLLTVLNEYATLLANLQDGEQAEQVVRKALPLIDEQAQPGWAARAHNSLGLALSSQRRFDESAQAFDRALALHQRNASGMGSIAMNHHNRALMEIERGDYVLAEKLLRDAGRLRLAERGLSSEWWGGQYLLMRALAAQGQREAALALVAELEQVGLQLYGPRSDNHAALNNEVAGLLQDSGRYDESMQYYQRVLEHYRALAEGPDMGVARTLNNMATLEQSRGDWRRAGALFQESLQMRRQLLGAQVPQVWQVETNLARLLILQGELQQAGPLLENAAAGWAGRVPVNHPQRQLTALVRAELALARGDLATAARRLAEVEAQISDDLRVQRRHLQIRGSLQLARGEQAAGLASREQLLALYRQQFGHAAVDTAQQQLLLAQALAAAGQCGSAREQAVQALPGLQPMLEGSHSRQQAQRLSQGLCGSSTSSGAGGRRLQASGVAARM